jgi:MFS superfamily sulfate permease-like transporter
MARFYGNVGYGESVESPPESGVWVMQITELPYYGDVNRNTRRLESGDGLNKDITVSNTISILADDHAVEHFHDIKYVMWEGVRWTVTNVEVQRPRLILSLGSVYNGPTP